jgi:hypothetical protein
MLINPITMLTNLSQRAKINKLPPPAPGAPAQPMDPGKPLFQRPAVLGLLLPVLVIGALVYNAQSDPTYASVGDCVHNDGTSADPDVVVVPCSGQDAQARIVGKVQDTIDGQKSCRQFDGADGFYAQEQGSDKYTLCLHFLK